MTIADKDARELAIKAWNTALKYIQDQMGVTSGDLASHFFADPENEIAAMSAVDLLADYVAYEYVASEEEPIL